MKVSKPTCIFSSNLEDSTTWRAQWPGVHRLFLTTIHFCSIDFLLCEMKALIHAAPVIKTAALLGHMTMCGLWLLPWLCGWDNHRPGHSHHFYNTQGSMRGGLPSDTTLNGPMPWALAHVLEGSFPACSENLVLSDFLSPTLS